MREYNNVTIKLINYKASGFKQKCEEVAVDVAEEIISKSKTKKGDIGVLLYVTQSPRFMTPSTSFYIHKQLKLCIDCFQFDINQGSTGFLIGLQLIISLMQGFEMKKKGLLLVGDENPMSGSHAAGLLVEHCDENSRIYICNYSLGRYYKKFYKRKGEVFLDDSFHISGQKYLREQIDRISDYAKSKKIQISQIISCDNQCQSSTEVLEKLCELKPEGNVVLGTFGAGISVTTGILGLKKNMFYD